jgi:hypothetical protein
MIACLKLGITRTTMLDYICPKVFQQEHIYDLI